MLKSFITCLFISIFIFAGSSNAKKYRILFDKDVSYYQAVKILNKISYDHQMVNNKISEGKISFQYEYHPSPIQIQEMMDKSKSLVQYHIILPRANDEWISDFNKEGDDNEEVKIENAKMLEYFNLYNIVFSYKVGADEKTEIKIVKEVFGVEKVSYTKDANEVIIEIPDNKWTDFLSESNKNEKILQVREVFE